MIFKRLFRSFRNFGWRSDSLTGGSFGFVIHDMNGQAQHHTIRLRKVRAATPPLCKGHQNYVNNKSENVL
jgi:hypothetical protein